MYTIDVTRVSDGVSVSEFGSTPLMVQSYLKASAARQGYKAVEYVECHFPGKWMLSGEIVSAYDADHVIATFAIKEV